MIPIRLELHNFLPYRAPDPIVFDGIALACLTGQNGAGKTTLMKILLGLIKTYSGDVKIFNKNPNEVDPSLIGYVPQIKTMDRSLRIRRKKV